MSAEILPIRTKYLNVPSFASFVKSLRIKKIDKTMVNQPIEIGIERKSLVTAWVK